MIARAFEEAIRAQLAAGTSARLSLDQLCDACAEVASLGTSIVLSAEGRIQAAIAATQSAVAVEDLQFKLGEGPGVDAYFEGRPILIGDLPAASSRWMHFVPGATALGIGAVFAYPLQLGAIRVGVLSMYANRLCIPEDGQLREMAELANLVTDAVLAMQSGVPTEELGVPLAGAADHRAVVQQAIGAIAMQLECSPRDALARLRARAFAEGVDLDDVAYGVVQGRTRFER